jgi:hypothetical protein
METENTITLYLNKRNKLLTFGCSSKNWAIRSAVLF